MKNLKYLLIIFMSVLIVGLSNQVNADVGPKPTTEIQVIGLDEPYYFDLMYEEDTALLSPEDISTQIEYDYYMDSYPEVLNNYQDSDGFVSYTLYEDAPHSITLLEEDLYHCGYWIPPTIFKVVLVTMDDKLIISEVVTKTLFNASFTFDVSDVTITDDQDIYMNVGSITESIPVKSISINILICVVITVLVESFILLAFGYRKKESFKKVILVNIITQFILQSLILFGYLILWDALGAIAFLVIGEVAVFIIEIIVYIKILKEKTKSRAALYGFIANLITFIIGILNLSLLTSLFNW